MPQFKVGDEFEYTGSDAKIINKRYSHNGRTFIATRVEAHAVWFVDPRGHDLFFTNNHDLRLAGPPDNVRAMSYLILQKLESK